MTCFWGPILWMIEAAVILSGVLRHWPDFLIILVLLLANAGIGFWEEHQAGKAIAAMKAELAIKPECQGPSESPCGRSGDLLAGGHQKSWLVAC